MPIGLLSCANPCCLVLLTNEWFRMQSSLFLDAPLLYHLVAPHSTHVS